ncbi:MAG: glutamyl-tRNA reductase [Acidobacteriota bacterium]|nr:MAG: glutamyl-tRNA reductase [Acidobacteriota bacterium]
MNHKTAPIEVRERVAFTETAIPDALRCLQDDFGFQEAMIVSTCNRVEVFGKGSDNGTAVEQIKEFLARHHQIGRSLLDDHLYSYMKDDLVRHVFRVASSLDSMVPGEAQILGQLKTAFATACDEGVTGTELCRLLPHAFFVAKRVRNETKIASSAVSISSVAVELARKIFGDLDGQKVLLIGAGKMSELAAQSLLKSGASKLEVTNRTLSKAAIVADKFNGSVVPFEQMETALIKSDIVIVSTGAKEYVLNPDVMDRVIRKRKYDPLFVIDISVPRNVNPEVNEIENVFLYDIDDLQSVVESNLEERAKEAASAEEIIVQEVGNFSNILSQRNLGPLVKSLRTRLETICLEELGRDKGGLTDADYEKVQRIMLRAAHRIAHPLMMEIKKAQSNPSQQYHKVEMIREAFDLDDSE